MKKLLSLVLCLCLICSFATLNISAEEISERVLNNFDDIGTIQYFGPNNQGFDGALSSVDYTEIDPTYTGGNVMQIYVRDAVNYGGWCFNFDPSWASADYDLPVGIKFQVWADTEGMILHNWSGFSQDSWASWNPSDVKSSFKDGGMEADMTIPLEPTWVTLSLNNVKVPYTSRLGARFQIGGTQGKVFTDNVTLIYEPVSQRKASFDVEGVDDMAVDAEGKVTLPDAEIEGKHFVGWKDEMGSFAQPGETVKLQRSMLFSAVSMKVELQTGAGIRWAEEETERGIRFETYVTKETLDLLGSSNFELGTLILPYKNYDADITVENASTYGAVNVVDPKVYGTVVEDYRYYAGIVDFEKYFATSGAALADLKLTAVSYIKVNYSNGAVKYFYDHPDATDNVRSVSEVARAALADTEFSYTDKQIQILELYTKYSQETGVPSYRTDKADNMNFGERQYRFIGDITEKEGSGWVPENMDNGAAINEYTPAGYADIYSHPNFTAGNTLTFTLPDSFPAGTYKIAMNTRGSSSNRVEDVQIDVTSNAGTFTVAEHQTFKSNKSSSWWYIELPNTVQLSGKATFTLTSLSSAGGKISLYDVIITEVK